MHKNGCQEAAAAASYEPSWVMTQLPALAAGSFFNAMLPHGGLDARWDDEQGVALAEGLQLAAQHGWPPVSEPDVLYDTRLLAVAQLLMTLRQVQRARQVAGGYLAPEG